MGEIGPEVFEMLTPYLCETDNIRICFSDFFYENVDMFLACLFSQECIPISPSEVGFPPSPYTSEVVAVQIEYFHNYILRASGIRLFHQMTNDPKTVPVAMCTSVHISKNATVLSPHKGAQSLEYHDSMCSANP